MIFKTQRYTWIYQNFINIFQTYSIYAICESCFRFWIQRNCSAITKNILKFQWELSLGKVFAFNIIAFYLYFVSSEKGLHSFLQLPTMHTNWLELKLPNIDPLKLLWTFLFANRLSPLFSLFYVTSLSISIIPSVILFYLCIRVLLRRMQLQRKSKLIKYWAP